MGYLPGALPAGAVRSGGRIVRRSVVHTPRHWETGRLRAAQFAPWAVYILGVYRQGRRDDMVREGRCAPHSASPNADFGFVAFAIRAVFIPLRGAKPETMRSHTSWRCR